MLGKWAGLIQYRCNWPERKIDKIEYNSEPGVEELKLKSQVLEIRASPEGKKNNDELPTQRKLVSLFSSSEWNTTVSPLDQSMTSGN